MRKVDSRVSGVDADVPTVCRAQTESGATACAIGSPVYGRPLHMGLDAFVYFKDDGGDWRRLTSLADVSASDLAKAGISDDSPIVPDAFGKARKARRIWCAPIDRKGGLTLIVR